MNGTWDKIQRALVKKFGWQMEEIISQSLYDFAPYCVLSYSKQEKLQSTLQNLSVLTVKVLITLLIKQVNNI